MYNVSFKKESIYSLECFLSFFHNINETAFSVFLLIFSG